METLSDFVEDGYAQSSSGWSGRRRLRGVDGQPVLCCLLLHMLMQLLLHVLLHSCLLLLLHMRLLLHHHHRHHRLCP
jgi:hypothetical protein